MNYNDFPILSDDAYDFLRDKYKNEMTFDRETSINKVCYYLNECVGSCKSLKSKLNLKLRQAIEFVDTQINKTLSSLNETFDIRVSSNSIKEFNLFTFLKYLASSIEMLINLGYKEEKEYYKKVYNICLNSLIESIKKILEALETSNIGLYKFM